MLVFGSVWDVNLSFTLIFIKSQYIEICFVLKKFHGYSQYSLFFAMKFSSVCTFYERRVFIPDPF